MTSELVNQTAKYSLWEFKSEVEYVDDWFLMGSPIPIIALMSSYWLFVLKVGPMIMKNRKPFVLSNVLAVYNLFQVILSFLIFSIGMQFIRKEGLWPTKCIADTEDGVHFFTHSIHFFMMAKITELMDTIFFVLRKKDRQISFLHVYHHSITIVVSWAALKLEPVITSAPFLATINALVHVIMYTYYGLSAYPSLTKYLWWKKYITKLQLVQFMLIIMHVLVDYKVATCKPSRVMFSMILANVVLFLFLFADFYVKSYLNKNNAKANLETKNTSQSNGTKQNAYAKRPSNSNETYENKIRNSHMKYTESVNKQKRI